MIEFNCVKQNFSITGLPSAEQCGKFFYTQGLMFLPLTGPFLSSCPRPAPPPTSYLPFLILTYQPLTFTFNKLTWVLFSTVLWCSAKHVPNNMKSFVYGILGFYAHKQLQWTRDYSDPFPPIATIEFYSQPISKASCKFSQWMSASETVCFSGVLWMRSQLL